MNTPASIFRLLISLALVVALATSGLGHRVSAQPQSPELASYIAAGGTLADLCGGQDGQPGLFASDCEACRLVNAAILNPPCTGAALVLSEPARKLSFVAKTIQNTRPADPARQPRAPPQA